MLLIWPILIPALAGALTVLPLRTQEAALRLKYTDGVWTLENAPELDALLLLDELVARLLRDRVAAKAVHHPADAVERGAVVAGADVGLRVDAGAELLGAVDSGVLG